MYYYPADNQTFENHSAVRAYFKWVFFPVVITDDMLEYVGVYPLVYEPPEVSETQIAEPTTVENIDGQWVQQWNVRDRTPEEMPQDPEDPPEEENPPVDPEPTEPVQSSN